MQKEIGVFAGDYVEAMWLMLQQETPDDYVVATGESHSIRDFLDEAFGLLDLDWREYVEVDPRYFRAAEVDLLQGRGRQGTQNSQMGTEGYVQGAGKVDGRALTWQKREKSVSCPTTVATIGANIHDQPRVKNASSSQVALVFWDNSFRQN